MVATAISIKTESGDDYLFLQEDGFSVESMIDFLKKELGDEYPWISSIHFATVGWNSSKLDISKVFANIYAEVDKLD